MTSSVANVRRLYIWIFAVYIGIQTKDSARAPTVVETESKNTNNNNKKNFSVSRFAARQAVFPKLWTKPLDYKWKVHRNWPCLFSNIVPHCFFKPWRHLYSCDRQIQYLNFVHCGDQHFRVLNNKNSCKWFRALRWINTIQVWFGDGTTQFHDHT